MVKPFATISFNFWWFSNSHDWAQNNIKFVSLRKNDSLEKWSNDLRNYFNSINDEWLMMTVDDSMLTSRTDSKLYDLALDYLQKIEDSLK